MPIYKNRGSPKTPLNKIKLNIYFKSWLKKKLFEHQESKNWWLNKWQIDSWNFKLFTEPRKYKMGPTCKYKMGPTCKYKMGPTCKYKMGPTCKI